MPMQYIAAKAARLRASIEHPRRNPGGHHHKGEEAGAQHAEHRHEAASIERPSSVGRRGGRSLAKRPPRDDAAANDDERDKREKLSHTPAEGMVRTLEEIERRYGDVAAYLRAAGLTEGQIERLRDRLVAP